MNMILKMLCCLVLSGAPATACAAQNYPARPVRVVVPFAPGGPMDILSRALGERITSRLGQQVVVDNRGGGSGTIGSEIVARAAPDGYTLLAGHSGTHVVNVSLFKKLPYDPLRDFSPITLTATLPMALLVHPSISAKSVQELIALAKAKPGELNYATASSGGPTHMSAVLLTTLAGINIVHVPYNGNAPALNDTIAGRVQIMFSNLLTASPLANAGKLRMLAITTAKRTRQAPDLPTIAESGVPGYDYTPWFAMFSPARTPRPVLQLLNAEIIKAIDSADMQQKFSKQAIDLTTSTPEALDALIRSEIPKWRKIVRDSGASVG
ncbi:MAG: tripartite tricarboxylate transporter substrate binding protein [Betaproteobacteria bacterium]|nr:MAG: tripartite tricarboxylate transporter substrate binding protein [Betaproteobacteria bacterium]